MLDKEVAQFLHSRSGGAVVFDEEGTNGNCFLGVMPSEPDTAVMIEPSGGPALNYPSPTLHLIVRGTYALAKQVFDLLTAIDGLLLGGGTYVVGCLGGQPAHMGTDENGRHEYSLNFQFVTE
jgi:hypothetical protein